MDAIEIRLEPTRLAQVKVADGDGQPIQIANVAMQLDYPVTIGPKSTDAEGRVAFQVPASEAIKSVVAWKDHAGLDYKLYTLPRAQAADRLTEKPEFPVNTFETLVLEGAAPVIVRITDTGGEPIVDAQTSVWLLRNAPDAEQLNLGYFMGAFSENTDSTGRVTFDWFPSWQKSPTTIWPNAEGFVRSRGNYDPATHSGSLDIQLERLVPIRGLVTFPDERPAANVAVTASGAGYTMDRFHGVAKTDESGRYEIMAYPNQIYMVYISDKQWSAPSQSGFAALPGKEVKDRDFVLSRSTRVFGQVLDAATNDPLEGKFVVLTQRGIDLNAMGDDVLPNPEGSNLWVCPVWQQAMSSAGDGRFEFFVGEGDYHLFIQGFDAEKFTISQEVEKHVDLRIEVEPQKVFTGLVVDKMNQPIGAAQVQAVSRNFRQHNDWQATTTADGTFEVDRFAEPSYLHVTNSDGTLGAITEIESQQSAATLQLEVLGSANGRLLTEDGSHAAVGVKLIFGIRIYDEDQHMSTTRFGQVVTTDSNGEFTLPKLVPGWDYECTLYEHPSGRVLNVAKIMIEPGESKQLGELKTPEAPKPYVPPTLEERTQAAFEVSGTPLERFEKAKRLIKQVNQNLLIVFANPANTCVRSLMRVRYEDEDFRPYRDDFRFMAITTAGEGKEAAQALAATLELPSLESDDGFLLVVVNHEGQVVAKLNGSAICDGDQISKDLFFAELDKYRTTPLDARELLNQSLARAERENKCVIVQETATWCGPCHMLSGLLQENRQWEKDYIWVKMDHRWTGAVEIMQELRDGAEGGIPWFAILDSGGNKLATSNHPNSGSNIGFPSEVDGQQHFANMLKSTRTRMTDQEIADLVDAAAPTQ